MDTVARLGGDEFVILVTDIESQLHAVDLSTRLLSEVRRRPKASENGERVSASIGISVSTYGRGSAEAMLSEADTAMYQAKSGGGARAEVFDAALGRMVQQRSVARRMLQSALDERRVVAYYQPIISLNGGSVVGFEALARITASDGAVISPAEFIPVAEDSGLVVPLGAEMLEMACLQAQRWQPARPHDSSLTVAVNVSARQLQAGDLSAVVRDTLKRTGLNPGSLHLEITETAIIDLRPGVVEQLARIGELGVEIGLDDFGTGYASLTHLRRLPLTFVKIDRSFVDGLGTDEEDDRIVSAVVDLAANLGLRSIAEGVETADQLARLRALGCDEAQGFLFARPLPSDDVSVAIAHATW
jgi:predicted signal transduction protein with EAL and GGDEF domain